MNWFWYAVISMFFASGLTLSWIHTKKLGLISDNQLITGFFMVTALVFLLVSFARKEPVGFPPKLLPWFLLMAAMSVGYNFALLAAFNEVNAGYVKAIGVVEVAIVFAASYFLWSNSTFATTEPSAVNSLAWMQYLGWEGSPKLLNLEKSSPAVR